MKKQLSAFLLAAALAVILLAGCTPDQGGGLPPAQIGGGTPAQSGGGGDPDYIRTPPPVLLAEYVGTNQQQRVEQRGDGEYNGLIDMTNLAKGYVTAQFTAPVQAKLRVMKGAKEDGNYDTYALDNTGVMNFFPITRGDGYYTFILYVYTGDTPAGPGYEAYITVESNVALESEFAPFLVPSIEVNYNADSNCVALSHEITIHSQSNLEVVQQVYAWIADNVSYDTTKAESLRAAGTGYLPNPDDTLRTRTGICYDYAALAAAMLRANGIPTQMVKGDVATGDGGTAYHAWNMVWLEETGWIAVGLEVDPNDWTRIDTTFAASGGSGLSSFIGDGSNYTTISIH